MQNSTNHPPAHYSYGRFDRFELLAEAIRDWDLDFKQIDAGDSKSELLQMRSGPFSYSRAVFSRAYYQQVAAPEGMCTFAFFGPQTDKLSWCGRDTSTNALVRFPESRAIEAITEAGVEIHTLSIDDEYLESLEGQSIDFSSRHLRSPGKRDVIQNAAELSRLRSVASRILRELPAPGEGSQPNDQQEALLQVMAGSVLNIAACVFSSQARPPRRLRQIAFRKAINYIYSNGERSLRLRELCAAADVSERTLEYAFKENVGISPKSFMSRWRLCGVRKLLLSDDRADSDITTMAGQWGFWHMGQFARDYHRHFGELPSATLKRVT